MSSNWGLFVLIAVLATSLGLGSGCAYFLVRATANRVLWTFSVPFTLWWLVAALSVAVYGFDVRVSVPTLERSAPAPTEPLTPRGSIDIEAR